MRDSRSHPHLAAAQRALAAGDMDALRGALLELDDEERRIREVHLGPAGVDRTRRAVRQRRRARGLGRVVVIHGIMGSQLEAGGAGGSTELIWTSYWRLGLGRFVDLKLVPGPGGHIVVGGLFPDYLPLVTQLSARWDVLPFAFDWRIDVAASALA